MIVHIQTAKGMNKYSNITSLQESNKNLLVKNCQRTEDIMPLADILNVSVKEDLRTYRDVTLKVKICGVEYDEASDEDIKNDIESWLEDRYEDVAVITEVVK